MSARVLRLCVSALLTASTACGDVVRYGIILNDEVGGSDFILPMVIGTKYRYSSALCGGASAVCWVGGTLFGDNFSSTTYEEEGEAIRGNMPDSHPEWTDQLDELHWARWLAEETIRRAQSSLGDDYDSSPLAAEANIWAGLSNRLLGETFCHAVIDGGPLEDRIVHFARAEEQFTEAIRIATAEREAASSLPSSDSARARRLTEAARLLNSAYGGRASVRVVLGDWTGAVTDAGAVPTSFMLKALFSTSNGDEETNTIYYNNSSRTDVTLKLTWFENYDRDSPDPRVVVTAKMDSAGNPVKGSDAAGTPVLVQNKFVAGGDDVEVVTGAEMRLIEIESLIRDAGTWVAGRDLLSDFRASVDPRLALDPAVVNSKQEAFNALVRERAIVLWNEGRRGGDIYRWLKGGEYTSLGDDEIIRTLMDNVAAEVAAGKPYGGFLPINDRSTCFPISRSVRSTNPNIPN